MPQTEANAKDLKQRDHHSSVHTKVHKPGAGEEASRSTRASSSSSSEDDATLTTRCLLQYCAQWPQHKAWVQHVLAKDGFNLEYLVGTPFQTDKATVTAAVSSCGSALQFASQRLKADRDVLLAAVNNDPFALGFAAEELRADAGVVLAALRRDPAALALADSKLFHSSDFMLAAIKLDATAATYAAPKLLSNPDFRAAAKAANSYVGSWFVNTEHFPGLQQPEAQEEFHSGRPE